MGTSSVRPEQPAKSLLVELATAAARDIVTYLDEKNPNSNAAGRSALHSLNAVLRCATTARDALLRDLHDETGEPIGRTSSARGRF